MAQIIDVGAAVLAENERFREENARLSQQLTCIDLWLNRREPVKYKSATLRHVQEEVERLTRERDEARAEVARLRAPVHDPSTCSVCQAKRDA